MILTPALLLFTTLTSVGLLAAWAATSRRHWFVRTLLFLCIASLPLLIPAYEMFVAFVLQGLVVAFGVQTWRWRRRESAEGNGTRFALQDALLAVVPLAVLTAAAVRLSALDLARLSNAAIVGISAAIWMLAGLWAGARDSKLLRRLAAAILLVAAASVPLVLYEPIFPALLEAIYWATRTLSDMVSRAAMIANRMRVQPTWAAIGVLATLSAFGASRLSRRLLNRPRLCVMSAATAIAALAVLPLLVLTKLMHPDPILPATQEQRQGAARLNGVLARWPNSPIVDTPTFDDALYDGSITLAQLESAAAEVQPAYDALRESIQRGCCRSLTYTQADLDPSFRRKVRSLSRGLRSLGYLAERENDGSRAIKIYSDMLDLANSTMKNGLIVDSQVGASIGGIAISAIYRCHPNYPKGEALRLLAHLRGLDSDYEGDAAFLARELVWTQHALGWEGHLTQILCDWSSGGGTSTEIGYSYLVAHYLVGLRLLQVEIALGIYRSKHGEFPSLLSDLTPEILPFVPLDPFAADLTPVRYRKNGDEYSVYSVWIDQIDDGGVSPTDNLYVPSQSGDATLDGLYPTYNEPPLVPVEPDENENSEQ
ncbi:hypothetical protein KOR34_44060 [Posidoniimonas corsicana]|uniref:Uncharacterized protein n=1 Tax=Posidoniimonas corsicana TaxID=1938618 RepID=A0A5C5UZW9_9BACT|nr:hypothetical protein [Posidoniimonas corsicana]TWT31032.1 hypothetical protein KOR34_44060 [Posidoniimonas corsicana]